MAYGRTVERVGYVDSEHGELITTFDLKYYRFLVSLRNAGVNMWSMMPEVELQGSYDLSPEESQAIVQSWIQSFRLPISEQPNDGRYES